MSAKIFTGVVFDGIDIDGIVAEAPAWQARIEVLTKAMKARWFARKAVAHFDKAVLGAEYETSPLSETWKNYHKDVARERSGYRHPETDFEFLLTLFPLDGGIYGIVRTERHDWFEEYVASHRWISKFPYWNHTDRPDDVTEEEWDRRNRIWNRAVDVSPSVALDYTVETGMPSDAAIIAAVPSHAERIDLATKDRTMAAYVASTIAADPGNHRLVVEAISKFVDWIETDVGKAARVAERERISLLLPETIDIEDLRRIPAPIAQAANPAP